MVKGSVASKGSPPVSVELSKSEFKMYKGAVTSTVIVMEALVVKDTLPA